MLIQQDVWVSTSEAVALSGYSSEYLRELARTKRIRAKHVGTIWVYDRHDLLKYRQEQDDNRNNRR